jgi:hypothetical protein
LPDDPEVFLHSQELGHPRTKDCLIVGDDNVDHDRYIGKLSYFVLNVLIASVFPEPAFAFQIK